VSTERERGQSAPGAEAVEHSEGDGRVSTERQDNPDSTSKSYDQPT
jgi:hypothetical protein